jgi:hypothetical protein
MIFQKLMKQFLLFFLLLFTFSSVKSQNYENLRVSLLTVEPRSKAVWTIFGHTALRLYDPVHNIDAVFNWGTFDTSVPNFMLRFFQGKTDYFLSVTTFQSFMFIYAYDGAGVIEQILNIPDSEKEALLELLQTNLLPENVNYRYDFIFDNCTTRPRDIIERFCGGALIYQHQTQPVTLRQLIHECSQPYPWTNLGIDCVIGSGADSLILFRNELFLPLKLMDALDRSVVKLPDGSEQPMVLASEIILHSIDSQPEPVEPWCHPVAVGFAVFTLYLALIITGYYKKFRFCLPFALLFFTAGIGGCIVAGLSFFSLHPCVQLNWNLLWLHPLHFIACIGFVLPKSYQPIRWYHAVNFVLLSSFLLGWRWIPQELNLEFIPFILCMWVVSGYQIVVLKQKK